MQDKHRFLTHDDGKIMHGDTSHDNITHTLNAKVDDNTHSHDEHEHNHAHSHNHEHNPGDLIRETSGKLLLWCLIATFSFSLVEAVAGYLINSIALQADAVHMLTDAAGLLIAYIANMISRRPANHQLTFGYGKAEVLGALINCMFTGVLTIWLLFEVAKRFFEPVTVHGASLFIVASIGFLVNAVIVYVLHKHSHSLNIRAAMIHAVGDLLGSLVAIIAGAVIYFTDFYLVDPILSLIVIILLSYSNYKLIKKSMFNLMAGVPEHLDYKEVGDDLASVPGIVEVHDLHLWYISANEVALAAHVVSCKPDTWHTILQACQKTLRDKHQIYHITLQYEFDNLKCKDRGCC